MAISAANLKYYKCLNWTEAATHGGSIDTSSAITSGAANNIFDNVSNAERTSGTTDARKIYFRNENTDTYSSAKCWISANTPATNDTVYIRVGGTSGLWGVATSLSGTATFTNGATYIWTSSDLSAEISPGEFVFNSTDDTVTQSASIDTIGATYILLSSNYVGTTGDSKSIQVASIGFASVSWYQPTSKSDTNAQTIGSLVQDASKAIWIKRIVSAGGEGYESDTFTITCENTT